MMYIYEEKRRKQEAEDTWKAEVGGSWSEANLDKKLVRHYLKNKPGMVAHSN
jgi:hypothetical protein